MKKVYFHFLLVMMVALVGCSDGEAESQELSLIHI